MERLGLVRVVLQLCWELVTARPAAGDDLLVPQSIRRLALGVCRREGDAQERRGTEQFLGEPVQLRDPGGDRLPRGTILWVVHARLNLLRGRESALRGRRLTVYEQVVERAAASRGGAWMFVHALSAVDRRLLPLTRGRISIALGAPVALLETVGARTRRVRRTPLLYLIDDDAVVLVASNGGSDRHPAWLHNVRARPAVRLLTREHGAH